jgi:ABC-type multidrug transport system fused ATPase/permease subunit
MCLSSWTLSDAEVREGGGNLSAGERQLFCLARAILHNAACLVMDEATSSVDPGTEKSLLAAATRAFAGKTVVSIAVSMDRHCAVYSRVSGRGLSGLQIIHA